MDRQAMLHLFAVCMALAESQHLLPPATVQPPCRQVPLFAQDSKPARMLQRWGWRYGGPLLAPSALNPLSEPITVVRNEGTAGLGFSPSYGEHVLQGGGQLQQAAVAVAQLGERLAGLALGAAAPEQAPAVWGALHSSTEPVYGEGDLHQHYCAMAAEAAQQDTVEKAVAANADPHVDEALLFFLREGRVAEGSGSKEAARVRRRAGRYSMVEGKLQRRWGDGTRRIVPAADQRAQLIRDTHERTGHFGIKRTKHLLLASFWWPGLEADVQSVLSKCEPCARIRASFNAERPELQQLPIEGLFYRWGADMAGPFAESKDGNSYVLIMVEYFSKTIELTATKEKSARGNAHAFLAAVLSRYGACAEVVTDRGTEFEGPFEQLLVDCLIDHRRTSPNHPQADGLAERAVQTVKKALTKHVAQHRELGDWDWQLHWIALGYRASRQAATGLSPYEMLFGTRPIIPPAIKERMEEPLLDLADTEQAAEYIVQRAALLQQHCAIAMDNQRIAQHRNSLRYLQVRSGNHMPVRHRFAVGDFVYVRRRTVVNSLQSEAKPGIYRIVELRLSGVVVVMGRCGTSMSVNVEECAPCHLTNINPALDPRLQRVEADFPCSVCGTPEDDAVMLICDGCFQGFHIYCLQPPLAAVPEEDVWLCASCQQQGVTAEAVGILRQQNLPVAQSDAAVFPNVQQRQQDAAAQALHGKVVWLSGLQAQGTLEYVSRVQRQDTEHSRCPLRALVQGKSPVYLSFKKAERLVKDGLPARGGQVAVAQLPEPLATVFVAATEQVDPREFDVVVAPVVLEGPQLTQAIRDWCEAEPTPQLVQAAAQACRRLALEARGRELGIGADLVGVLLLAVDLRSCAKLAVVGGSCSALAECVQQRHMKLLWEKDKQQGQGLDQVTAAWYKQAHLRTPLDWVFGCPPDGALELALGLAVQQARQGVALLVRRAVLTSHSSVLAEMLQRFVLQQRLVCITSTASDAAWLVVFASAQLEQAMVSLRGQLRGTGWLLAGLL